MKHATKIIVWVLLLVAGALGAVFVALMRDFLPRRIIASSLRDVYGDPSRVQLALVDRCFDLATREGNREALVARFNQTKRGRWRSEYLRSRFRS